MKKIIVLCCFTLCTLAVHAQDFGVYEYAHPNRPDPFKALYHKITRYVAQQQKLPWAQAIHRQIQKANPQHLIGLKLDYISPRTLPRLSAQEQVLLRQWQQAITQNRALAPFKLKVLNPHDLRALSGAQRVFLLRFFQNGTTQGSATKQYQPAQVDEFKHYIVRLTLQAAPHQAPVYLIANCYTRELFVSFTPNPDGIALEPYKYSLLGN